MVLNKNSKSAEILRWDIGIKFVKSFILQLNDNVKRSIEQKLQKRELPGKSLFGYENIERTDDSK